LNHNATVSMTHNFSNALINEARGAFTRFDVGEKPQDRNFDATSIGMPYAQMMTTQLSGIDAQYSGAEPGIDGAYGSWSGGASMAPTLLTCSHLRALARLRLLRARSAIRPGSFPTASHGPKVVTASSLGLSIGI